MVSYFATAFAISLYVLGITIALTVSICLYLGVRKAIRLSLAEERDNGQRRTAR